MPVYPGLIYGPGKVTSANIVARMVNISYFFLSPSWIQLDVWNYIIFQLMVRIKITRFNAVDFGDSYIFGNVFVVD